MVSGVLGHDKFIGNGPRSKETCPSSPSLRRHEGVICPLCPYFRFRFIYSDPGIQICSLKFRQATQYVKNMNNYHRNLNMRDKMTRYSYEVGYSPVIVVCHFVTPSVLLSIHPILDTKIEQKVFEPQPCYFTHRCILSRRQND